MQVVVQLCAGCRYVPWGCVEDRWERFRWGGDCEFRGEYRACREQRPWRQLGDKRQPVVESWAAAGLQVHM